MLCITNTDIVSGSPGYMSNMCLTAVQDYPC
jgi:hypothetical protein